jgi:uncharacterized membrane protein (UPF0136 family)
LSQTTYVTLLLTGIYLFWRACNNRSIMVSITAGIIMALAHMSRSEGILVFIALSVVILVCLCLQKAPLQAFLPVILGWTAFLVVNSPYLYFLHEATGHWQLTGKSRVTIADALMDYLGRPDLKREPGFKEIGYLDVITKYPDYIRMTFSKNIKLFWNETLPLYIWALVLIGFCAGAWSWARTTQRFYLLATLAPLLIIIPLFFIGPAYTLPYVPTLFLWSSEGMVFLGGLLRKPGANGPEFSRRFLTLATLIVGIYACYHVINQIPPNRNSPYHYSQDGGRYDHKLMGQLLRKYLPPGVNIMSRWGRIGFYAERGRVEFPQTDLEETIKIARKSGAKYLILDGQLLGSRPQLAILFSPLDVPQESMLYFPKEEAYRPHPNLKMFMLYKDPASLGMVVYELVD